MKKDQPYSHREIPGSKPTILIVAESPGGGTHEEESIVFLPLFSLRLKSAFSTSGFCKETPERSDVVFTGGIQQDSIGWKKQGRKTAPSEASMRPDNRLVVSGFL